MDKELHHLLENICRTVAGNFGGVLARIGVRCAEKTDQYFVNNFPFVVLYVTEGKGIGIASGQWSGGVACRGEDAVGNSDCIRS